GVTLFGIFLTPVFFFVIDWLGESSIWNMPGLRQLNQLSNAALRGLHRVATLGLGGAKKDERVTIKK
ncbi:MAG: hypothetical protein K8U57_17990, partial [Planctomycetes bacterium]|nr:hypothetical protein [Planctomycetota bacterium]